MSTADGRLAGKAGVVTGAISGIGRTVVLAMGRDVERGNEVVRLAQEGGANAALFRGDVTTGDNIVDAITLYRSMFGRFDIMHNNAGICPAGLRG
ncbi:SDR family NAD(P)-dependent oxidoreductase [Mycolicibacterium sp. P9-22]|uniref:SDR family NAD(P)-dependent oxidoreductase n=1 Tax=Mycolicibacterium sp. P9-22 TaxID=2024613 RepID=UPI0018844305|nr:SDR family NAD(P)-dependent oxidoreductase [Mycolicibacterium sp. P9-22]